jgi:hypothetical protein
MKTAAVVGAFPWMRMFHTRFIFVEQLLDFVLASVIGHFVLT